MSERRKPIDDAERKINEIMDEFSFSRVRKAMAALKWHWHVHGNEEELPSEARLRRTARRLLKMVAGGESGRIGTGGFYAERCEDGLCLQFVLEECESPIETGYVADE